MNNLDKVEVAIIGAGIGAEHVLSLEKLKNQGLPVNVVGLAKATHDLTRLRKKVSPGILPDSKIHIGDSAIWGLIKNPKVNTVVVATNDCHHFEYAFPSLSLLKHTFCEKPDVLSPKDGKDLLDLARIKRVFYGVTTQFRAHAPGFARIVRELDVNEVNVVYRMKPSPGKPNAGQNFLYHVLSLFELGTAEVTGFKADGQITEVQFVFSLGKKVIPVNAQMSYILGNQSPERSVAFKINGAPSITKTLEGKTDAEGRYREALFGEPVDNPRIQWWETMLRAITSTSQAEKRETEYQRTEAYHKSFFDAVKFGMPISFEQ